MKTNNIKLKEFADALSVAGKRGCEAGKALRRLAFASQKCSKLKRIGVFRKKGKINVE